MIAARHNSIKDLATDLLRAMWHKRAEIWPSPPTLEQLLPIPVDVIARNILGITIEEPEEIRFHNSTSGLETAGLMDRQESTIAVAQKYKPEYRRFTFAHEIGHWVLHTDLKLHRDRLVTGGERANRSRPVEELEADWFAAELLMPSKILKQKFTAAFGGPLDASKFGNELVVWFSTDSTRPIDQYRLLTDLRYRALIISEARSIGTRHFNSLTRTFGVSATAMAIQIEDLGLVT